MKDATADHDTILGTFGAYLTMVGSLILTLNLSHCRGLLSLDNLFTARLTSPGQCVLAAPFGVQASNPSATFGELGTASLAQTPNTQTMSFRGVPDFNDGLWKQACIRVLKLRGIPASTLEGCSWVHVTVARRRLQETKNDASRPKDTTSMTTIPWPGPLCFRQRAIETSTTSRLGDTILSGHDESRDPLGGAGRWLDSATERDEQLSRRRADRAAPQFVEIDCHASRSHNTDTDEHMPLNFGRPNLAVTAVMYPTPPDVLQHANGITPTFDGTTSSPRNPPLAVVPATIDPEDMAQDDTDMNNTDRDVWGDAKRERSLSDAANLLMGGDMFGDDNDITEDDFNFFDEQPGGELDLPSADGFDRLHHEPSPHMQIPFKVEETHPDVASKPPAIIASLEDAHAFTKPELKHARSLLTDAQATRPLNEQSSSSLKRESSPFNPETVFKRVRASLNPIDRLPPTPGSHKRKASVFKKIEFGPSLPMINKKYEKGGLFDFELAVAEEHNIDMASVSLPETNYLKRHGKRNRKLKEPLLPSGALMKRFTEIEGPTSHPSPLRGAGSPSDDDASSVESDQDDSSYTSEDTGSPMKPSLKRVAVDEDAASHVTSLRDTDIMDEPDQQLAMELPRLSKPERPEVLLSNLFKDPEPLTLELHMTDDDIVQIAQILTEQAATGSLNILDAHKIEASISSARDRRQHLAANARDLMNILKGAIPQCMEKMAPSRLKGLLEVPDIMVTGQPRGLQPRAIPGRDANADQIRPNILYQIPYPHLEVRKSDTTMSVLPSAITFWETLGLGPISGAKDAHALCVFPGWTGMVDSVRTFLERVKSFYELLKLGTFEKLPLSSSLEDGLLSYEIDKISTSPDASMTRQGSTLIESMDALQAAISDMLVTDANFVVFMVYTPSNPGTIVEACLAFQRFFESYRRLLASKREYPQNEIVLQLVSADLISSTTSLVMTPSADLVKLCMETYDRCTLFGGRMPAPAIVLQQQLPRGIDFKTTSTPSASLIHENSCIHVAYARSIDDRWVSAAWTDDRGNQQAMVSYCLGRKGRSLSTTMNDVAREIWEYTLELISHRKVHWRAIITKAGPMDPQEIEAWSALARTETKASVGMVLMTVNTNPSLQLIPSTVQVPPSATGFYTTPVSTPQANTFSPEATATPATPIRDVNALSVPTPGAEITTESESDAALVDFTDHTWGAVLGHRLSNSTTLLELQPALVSGYIIKRTGARLEDPPVVMEVNLLHTENTARPYEPLLRDMLAHFRGLGTLARARGVVDRADARPWHVAAVEKAVRALHMLM